MIKLVGQNKCISKIDKFTLDSFPSSILIVGDHGSGRHMICSYIAEKFNLEIEDITTAQKSGNDNQSVQVTVQDKIEQMYFVTTPHLYLVDGDLLMSRNRGEMNSLLKVMEDSIPGVFIAFLCESTSGVIETILNRCYIINMDVYSKNELSLFLSPDDKSDILDIAKTPGQILEFRGFDISGMVSVAESIIDKISIANYANLFNIGRKNIAFNNEQNKFNLKQFILVLLNVINKKYIASDNIKYYKMYMLTSNLYNNIKIFNIDTKNLFEHYLFELKQIAG